MRRILLFQNVSLDGYFEGPGHDISGFNAGDDRMETFPAGGENNAGTLLFGHRTYDMMKAFWPTPQAAEMMPAVAQYMNASHKYVASHQAFDPGWQNVTVLSADVPEQVRLLKAQPGGDIMMFGSNMLCVSLMRAGLMDEFQVVVNPIALGAGTPLFAGLEGQFRMRLKDTHAYPSGRVLLTYVPA